jgi:GNAT superfamily N-acetyltransferase
MTGGREEHSTSSPADTIRLFRSADEEAVVGVWYRAGRAAYPYLPAWQTMTVETARQVFHEHILGANTVWVGVQNGEIAAYLALNESFIDRLYVDPPYWRQGWGTSFIQFAKLQSPAGLELFTHQENHAARALYEKHGFVAVKFGISPPPESAPDVEYHWRP